MIVVVIVVLVKSTAWFFLPVMVPCLDRSRFRHDEQRRSANSMELGTDPLSNLNTKTGNSLFIGIRFSTPSVKVVKLIDKTFSNFKEHIVDGFWHYCSNKCFVFGNVLARRTSTRLEEQFEGKLLNWLSL